ncbi:dipeptidase [Novosphingobium sp. JCM 18896]|uniref:dipeptidase n=1 Tax=Novosphingobium sp. JCM 18896 TaxID=2989731 RepID=UPI00222365D5|nr:dipeptidase [Novosphingobium sp. JCM 18896]MCW1430363.1 dipeptidase [Novosphingobium sp. JCM 18896]
MRGTALSLALALIATGAQAAPSPEQVAEAALRAAPVWDGHNDVPEQLRDRYKNVIAGFDFRDTTNTADPAKGEIMMHTDLARLRKGHVGAQFWSVYVSALLPEPQAVQATLEQIDVTKRLIARYPNDMALCLTAADVEKAMKAGKIASLMGMEGGSSIGGSLAVLRQMYALGARYMTLTHFRNLAWADSATDAPKHDGLTDFGRDVVREMQRIGMIVDLSHVSEATMMDTLDVAKAPVMFSHSGARAVASHPRNVPDGVLDRLKANGGIVMVVTLPGYVSDEVRGWGNRRTAEKARLDEFYVNDPAAAKAGLEAWTKANPAPRSTLAQLADHIDHIVKRAGIDHVGLGGDFDGMGTTTQGMEDVAGYPALFAELAKRGYSQADLGKIASGNMLRVLKATEAYAAAHRADPPIESPTTF